MCASEAREMCAKRYELLDHTADAKFRAYGTSVEEAFSNAIEAVTAITTDPEQMKVTRELEISLRSESLEALLFDLISQLIFLIETEGFLSCRAKSLNISQTKEEFLLTTLVEGDDVVRYGSNLKAATYSEILVTQNPSGDWLIQAVVDI